MSGSHVPESQFEGLGCQGPVSHGPRDPGSYLPEFLVSRSQGSGSLSPGLPDLTFEFLRSWVSGPDFRLCPLIRVVCIWYIALTYREIRTSTKKIELIFRKVILSITSCYCKI